jgi:hypothetical protein
MKPDIDWPPELQAVMDKVLARDADERYQKSAEFGRDIAKAVENMPAAVAAAAGTMVMGAAAAGVPKTRMASKGGATAKIEAAVAAPAPVAAAPAKKSPVMMVVAAVVVIVGIGGAVLFMKGNGATAAPKSDVAAPNTPANNPKAGQPISTPQKDPVKPLSKGLSSAPGTNPLTNPAITAPAPSENASTTIAQWRKKLESDPTASDATSAIDALSPLMEKLPGQDRSNAYYVQMLAYAKLDDDSQVCRTSKAFLASSPDAGRAEIAKSVQQGRNCK